MPHEQNKTIVKRLFAAQLGNDLAAYAELLADDLQWEIMQSGIDRPRSKTEMLVMLGAVHAALGTGNWDKQIVGMVAEGDSVAVEATATMELANGKLYRQRYHYLYRLRGGQVFFAREYLDTQAAVEAFRGLPPIAAPNQA
ncbi:nuclear transport factor 2 family protein [Novosphingobium sp. PASSN1]|jgi:ketosteroid isomerase-like protein|uniref:nuclear transport factor 2 family protein n=1 Tax=Novosphingobium sp. PASSN1 TaxID=2015561 RepID=UPI000BD05A1D|nr:nuclear transport factor 2 family protein [Novosphingobium sp. PASSN1]OYU34765.1 MAG: hypothetical protein CFE35_12800 [Novosphingobium sp. PASSN1]